MSERRGAGIPRSSERDAGEREADAGQLAGDPLEHFWSAAHEFLQAMRALVDAADAYVEDQRHQRDAGASRLHRIDIE
jgi:hypothetical protein